MALSNHERIGKALELLRAGLGPFVEREMKNTYKQKALEQAMAIAGQDRMLGNKPIAEWDASALLKLMIDGWHQVFNNTLGMAVKSLAHEVKDYRNKWAHQQALSSDDADRALDSMARLLTAISASQADEINKMKLELRRVIFDEQMRQEKRKIAGTAIESSSTLKPWREVVEPHNDVASGRYQQAEFAADLWQVYLGEGSDEYRNPSEFFRRTYLTESLKQLLIGAVQRLAGKGGDPVIQLQTNFGGGKTHSMLALYHLFSGTAPGDLLGIDEVLKKSGVDKLPVVKKPVVLVGNRISPGNPVTKPDGTVVRTLWGELAWQLGGKKAFKRIQADDEKATNPGDVLRELMNEYAPCMILIDEWVAYARQLHDSSDLPAGSFETHFSFAQALAESARAAKQCLLVISLPASDTAGSPHTLADDVEVGGERGRAALDRLRNVIGRVESSWRPASAEEGFEIVRRRLFKPLVEKHQFVYRDTVARTFYELYSTQHEEFPPECRDSDYKERLKAAYPIHPEVFDRLYTDWSTLVKFQRTRGVLRLMAAVIHSLWEKGDRNPLILPAHISIDDPRVQFELTRYLSDNWVPVIEKDVDGPNALPLRLDGEIPNLGKFAACRRVARTIYLGSAPNPTAANRGIEDRRIKLGCVMPGEPPSIFGDALRRLATAATYLYQDGARYWYSTQPTVTKLAEDRAEQLKRNPDAVAQEIEKRLKLDLRKTGDFQRIHPMPQTSADVPDEMDARLVVLGIEHPYSKEPNSAAVAAAKKILESRGNTPRLYQNTLVFLAVDSNRLQDLDEAVRRFLAWDSIIAEKEKLDLSPNQVRQAEAQLRSADGVVTARFPEAYQWLVVSIQNSPQAAVEWQAFRLSGQDALAVLASKKLKSDELLLPAMAGTRLRMELDRVPLWDGNHVGIKKLAEYFAKYIYLPRLTDTDVLIEAIKDGVRLLSWTTDSFAYADRWDETQQRYKGLKANENCSVVLDGESVLVKPDVAEKQLEANRVKQSQPVVSSTPAVANVTAGQAVDPDLSSAISSVVTTTTPVAPQPRRFYGSVQLDATRLGRDAGKIAEEVVQHLAGLIGSKVEITLEIHADIPDGAPDNVVRTVTENCRTLRFKDHGFEMS